MDSFAREMLSLSDKKVRCKCPKCEKEFIKEMLWGYKRYRGKKRMPRQYCDDCKHNIYFSEEELDIVEYSIYLPES